MSSQGGALGAIVFSLVYNINHPGEVEVIPSLYGQLLTLYHLLRKNGLPPPSDNVIKHYFALKQWPLLRGSSEDSLYEGIYHLVVRADEYKKPVQRGMSSPSVMAGFAAYPSSSRGLGAVAQEYLKTGLMLYEKFITGGLSQYIKKDEGPDLRHTLVRHALLYFLSFVAFPGVDFASWRAEEFLVLIGESLLVFRQAGRDSTLSVYNEPAS
ncbi:hypothetical protein ACOSQ3_003205 [Xanthoceras sorbifolium]